MILLSDLMVKTAKSFCEHLEFILTNHDWLKVWPDVMVQPGGIFRLCEFSNGHFSMAIFL